MRYRDLRDFIAALEARGALKRVSQAVDPHLEVTALCRRALLAHGPALLFERPKGGTGPMLGNLFGSVERVMLALGCDSAAGLRELGRSLAFLREPRLPQGLGESIAQLARFKRLAYARPRVVDAAPFQHCQVAGAEVDLAQLPVQTCWPEDAGPLITWGLVVTRGPYKARENIGVYRQQVIGRNKLIMRWLPHRGGALDFAEWREAYPGCRFPLLVALGADPATMLAAVTPITDTISEFQFAGLLRGARSEVVAFPELNLHAPASAEFVLAGFIEPGEEALEGPFGDHTGYYNAQGKFPVFTVERIYRREHAIYPATYMGQPPADEPSVMAMALNEVFIPLLQQQFPEIVDFYLPPAACSYRIAVVSIKKRYAGHARRVMFGIWSSLRQFTYTKLLIVTDDDIDVRDWQAVLWALATRMDPVRDTVSVAGTPIDYLDFASPEAGAGGKLGLDATNKWPGETHRRWGRPIVPDRAVERRVDALYAELGLAGAAPWP